MNWDNIRSGISNAAESTGDFAANTMSTMQDYAPNRSNLAALTALGASYGGLTSEPGSRGFGALRGGLGGAAFAAGYEPGARLGKRYLGHLGLNDDTSRLVGGLASGTLSALLSRKLIDGIVSKKKPEQPYPYMHPAYGYASPPPYYKQANITASQLLKAVARRKDALQVGNRAATISAEQLGKMGPFGVKEIYKPKNYQQVFKRFPGA